jgi:hypothetical protein
MTLSWSNVFNLLQLPLQLHTVNCLNFSQFSIVPSKSTIFLDGQLEENDDAQYNISFSIISLRKDPCRNAHRQNSFRDTATQCAQSWIIMYAPKNHKTQYKISTLNNIDCPHTLPKFLQLFDERFHEDIKNPLM